MTANNTKSVKKRKAPPRAWKPGQSGNPAGRPRDGESWAAIIKSVGDMYPTDILAFIGENNDLGRALRQYPSNVQMKYLVTARVFSALMFEPTHGLWKELMERAEGKVKDTLDLQNSDGSLKPENEADDTRAEILRKLASIATATGADKIPERPDTGTT